MSYGYLVFKTTVPIVGVEELSEQNTELQDPAVVMRALSNLLPGLKWTRVFADSRWEALFEDEYARYEFHVGPDAERAWSISTSHLVRSRPLVPKICKALGVLAFDGQAMKLVDENGERPA